MVSKATRVLRSLNNILDIDDGADVAAELMQTSASAFADQTQELEAALATMKEADGDAIQPEERVKNAKRDVEETLGTLRTLEASLSQEEQRKEGLDNRLAVLVAAGDQDQDLIDSLGRDGAAAGARIQDLEKQIAEQQEKLQIREDSAEEAEANAKEFAKERGDAIANIRSLVSGFRESLKGEILPAIIRLSKVSNGYINLKTQNAQAGDVLQINLRVYGESTPAGSEEETYRVIPVAAVFIKDYGFKSTVADSFLLTKRRRDENDTSNFKGAAGASLLFSYQARPSQTAWNFVNGLSAGVNVHIWTLIQKKR